MQWKVQNSSCAGKTKYIYKGVYTLHLWRAQDQTTTYGIFYQDEPKFKDFREIIFFQEKKEISGIFFHHSSGPVQLPIVLRENYPKRIK